MNMADSGEAGEDVDILIGNNYYYLVALFVGFEFKSMCQNDTHIHACTTHKFHCQWQETLTT